MRNKQCDHCNKEIQRQIFCSTKCRVAEHRIHMNREIKKLVPEKILKTFKPLEPCKKHHGSMSCGC